MKSHTEELKKDKVFFVTDWWITKFEEIPPEAMLKILIDKRPKEIDNLVKLNRDQGSIKFNIWQKRPEFIKTLKSREGGNFN